MGFCECWRCSGHLTWDSVVGPDDSLCGKTHNLKPSMVVAVNQSCRPSPPGTEVDYSYIHKLLWTVSASVAPTWFPKFFHLSSCIPPIPWLPPLAFRSRCTVLPLPPASPTRTLALCLSLSYISVLGEKHWSKGIALFLITLSCGLISSSSFSLFILSTQKLHWANYSRCFINGLYAQFQAQAITDKTNHITYFILLFLFSSGIREFMQDTHSNIIVR